MYIVKNINQLPSVDQNLLFLILTIFNLIYDVAIVRYSWSWNYSKNMSIHSWSESTTYIQKIWVQISYITVTLVYLQWATKETKLILLIVWCQRDNTVCLEVNVETLCVSVRINWLGQAAHVNVNRLRNENK